MATKGLFLDLDGTLADSLDTMRNVYQRFMSQHNKIGSDEEFSFLNGPPLKEVITFLAKKHQIQEDYKILLAHYNDLVCDAYRDVSTKKGTLDLIKIGRQKNWKICLVTSNNRAVVDVWLKTNKLQAYFDEIVTGEDVKKGKPDPSPYLIGLQKTRCIASSSLAIEDSEIGAKSAIGAGLTTFLLYSSHQLIPRGTKAVIRDLSEATEWMLSRC